MLSVTVFTGRQVRAVIVRCRMVGMVCMPALVLVVGGMSSQVNGLTRWPLVSPGSLNLTGHIRARVESLDDQYRAEGEGSDQVMAFRTNLRLSIPLTHYRDGSDVVLEAMDSRQAQADDNTPLSTGTVNTLEAVQAKVSIRSDLLPWQLGKHGLDFGRQTMDVGSRRLIARNRYRNTLNTFDGLNLTTRLRHSDTALQAFLLYPVSRYPDLTEDLLNNQHEADKSSLQVQLFGVHADGYVLKGRVRGSVQWLSLREADTSRRESRNRQLNTYAGRLYLPSKSGLWDFDLEMIRQSGRSRASSDPTDTRDLKHDAWFHHLELGYQFRGYSRWRIVAQYDYASGDADPNDNKNNRFDTLYGARRFDFGPTGIFGSIARSNVVSPGLRMTFKPSQYTEVMFAWRWYELASAYDAWVGSGYQDTSGRSGRAIGQQAEFRFRWDLVDSVRFETGAAWLDLGDYANRVNSLDSNTDTGNDITVPESAIYSYGQITWTF